MTPNKGVLKVSTCHDTLTRALFFIFSLPERKRSHTSVMSQSRNWCFTWNNPEITSPELVTKLDNLIKENKLRYYICQSEIGAEGTPHFQGYLQLTRSQRMSAVKKYLSDRVHLSVANGTLAENQAYCSKEDTRAEGTEAEVGPWSGGSPADEQGRRNDIVAFIDSIKAGATDFELLEKHPKELCKYRHMPEIVRDIIAQRRDGPPLVVLFSGPAGCGKTRSAVDYAEKRGLSYWIRGPHKQWFQGYQGEAVAILDEVDKYEDQGFSLGLLLRILDRYAIDVEFKGGSKKFTSRVIIMTAVNPIESWFRKSDISPQIERRITEWYDWNEADGSWHCKTGQLYRPVKVEEVPQDVEVIEVLDD